MTIQEKINIISNYLKETNNDNFYILKKYRGKYFIEEAYFEIMQQSSPARYSLDKFLEKINAIKREEKMAEIRKKEDAWIAKHKGTDGIASYLNYKRKQDELPRDN